MNSDNTLKMSEVSDESGRIRPRFRSEERQTSSQTGTLPFFEITAIHCLKSFTSMG